MYFLRDLRVFICENLREKFSRSERLTTQRKSAGKIAI